MTSTKQFVWSASRRAEERDGSGNLLQISLKLGQYSSSIAYFYAVDHLASTREITNASGAIQSQYSYSTYGQSIQIKESIPAISQYAAYYPHVRSTYLLTVRRAYNANLGRFISRDPIAEEGGLNQYAYPSNPNNFFDPMGTKKMSASQFEATTGYPGAAASMRNAGCRGSVDAALGIPSAFLPEAWIFNTSQTDITKSRCFWGKGNNPDSAAAAANKCPDPCGKDEKAVIWCKQFDLENGSAGPPGSPVPDPGGSMGTPGQGEAYNYSVWTPSGYQGATIPGPNQSAYTNAAQPIGGESYGNSICCRSCVGK